MLLKAKVFQQKFENRTIFLRSQTQNLMPIPNPPKTINFLDLIVKVNVTMENYMNGVRFIGIFIAVCKKCRAGRPQGKARAMKICMSTRDFRHYMCRFCSAF